MEQRMRDQLIKMLHHRAAARADEDFFLAGPPAGTRRPADRSREAALLADIRRQGLHRHSLAA